MMNIESLRAYCLSFDGVTEEVKWGGQDLCFSVGQKMFCVTDADVDSGASFKVPDEEFEEMILRDGIIPAPYMGRYKWVTVLDFSRLSHTEWEFYLRRSYDLVKDKLPKKIRENL
jgi:predicted DNA-binding protein (MmcQ/YjbR family)